MIDFLMVEWHRLPEGQTQDELLAPLYEAGFLAIDLTPPTGNGFFYAVRMPRPSPLAGLAKRIISGRFV